MEILQDPWQVLIHEVRLAFNWNIRFIYHFIRL